MHYLTPSVFSPSCDWNMYTIRYAMALSKQRGMKRTATDTLGEEEEASSEVMGSEDEEEDMMTESLLVENWDEI